MRIGFVLFRRLHHALRLRKCQRQLVDLLALHHGLLGNVMAMTATTMQMASATTTLETTHSPVDMTKLPLASYIGIDHYFAKGKINPGMMTARADEMHVAVAIAKRFSLREQRVNEALHRRAFCA